MNFSFGGKAINTSAKFCAPIKKITVDEIKKTPQEIEAEKQKLKLEKQNTVEKWAKIYLEIYLNDNNNTTKKTDTNNTSTKTTKKEDDNKGSNNKKSAWTGYDISMVQEVRCFIPGCAPIEVCIVFSKEGSTSKTGKIFKPVIDCTENDVKDFINNFCNSTSPSDDLSNVNNNNTSTDTGINPINEDHPFKCPCCDPDIKNLDRMLNGKDAFLDAGW